MATYDGAIRIITKIDTAGVKTGLSSITSGLKSMAAAIGIAFSTQKIVEFAKASIEAASDLNEVQNVVDTTFGSMSSDINNFASTATEKFGLSTLAAKQYTGTMGAMLKSMGLSTSSAESMSTEIAGLSGDLASFYNLDTDTAFEKIRSGLSGETEPLKELGINLSEVNLSAYALSQGMTTAYSSMSEQQKVLVRYNYLLSVTSDAQGDFAKTSNSWANQVRVLQLNFQNLEATLGKAFIASLTPVLQFLNQLISDLTYAASVFTDFVYALTGTSDAASSTASAVSDLADATEDSADATDDSTDATDAASDSLADFDKLNTLSSSTTSSSTGTTATPTTASTTGTTGTTGTTDNTVASKIKTSLSGIYALLITSSALLVIGAILTFSGHPVAGIGLMLVGVAGLAVAATLEWGSINKSIKEQVSKVQAIVGAALLVLGTIIAFSGANIPLGIALMIAGSLNLASTVVVNWGSMSTNISNELSIILGFISSALLVLGVILCFLGVNLPLGIALIVIGAASLVSAIAVDWNSMSNHIASTVSIITGIVSGALLAIGAIMVFTGGGTPIGIALMVLGAASLATAIAVNWNAINSPLGNTISIITTMVGGSLLAIGALLTFSGGATPLGIALLAAGAAVLATSIAVNWNSTNPKVKTVISEITATVGAGLLALGAVLAFSNPFTMPLGIALMALGAASLATSIALNWENIVTTLKGPIGEVVTLVGTAFLALGAVLAFSGVNIPLGIALMAVGAVSLATVIAVNWNTITTALQGPIGAITAAASIALLALGVILCLSGVGIPLGIGLILAGAAGLATVIAVDWNTIPNKVAGVWDSIKKSTTGFINWMIGGIEWMVNKVIGGINWMIEQLNKISFSVPSWVPGIGGNSFGFSVSELSTVTLPRLAAGAVIPPNRQFAAILGDQTSGTNIETPLSTMTDAFKNALSEMGISGSNATTVNITASADSASLIKYFKFNIDKETTRVGTVMALGGVRG